MYKLWVNADQNGNIIGAAGGAENYIQDPINKFDYSFVVAEDVFKNISSYQVINNELVKRV